MKTIWALAGALCLVARFAQAAPTADVVQDVGNGVNQISEKSAEVPILSSEVEVDVATPILVARVSTLLTAATPAIYQDAAKNPNELSERIVKPITLLLNSVSGGVTTLAKDNSRRFFVPSFVRFNFRQDALLELDRIRRTERFWNETEQYVDSVCARLKKYIEVQRRRGPHGEPAPTPSTTTTTTTPAAAPSSAPTSTATTAQTKPFSTSFHLGVKSDLKLSIQESAEPIRIPIIDLPGKRKPTHSILRPRPTSEPHATVQTAPLKEPAAEVLAPKPINAVESIEITSAAPSEVPVETTSVPSKVEPSSTTTQSAPEITTEAETVVTTESVRSGVAITEASTPNSEVRKVPSVIDVKVLEESIPSLVVAESVPAESIVSATIVEVPAVESRSSVVPQSGTVPVVAPKAESVPEPIVPVEAKTPEVPQVGPVAEQDYRSVETPVAAPEEKSSPVADVREELSVAVVPQVESATPEIVPAVDVTTAEVPQTSSTTVPLSSDVVEPAVVAPVDIKPSEQTPVVATTSAVPPVETTTAQLPVVEPVTKTGAEIVPPVEVTTAVVPSSVTTETAQPTQPEVVANPVVTSTPAVVSPIVPESVVVPVPETASPEVPKAEVTSATVPEVVETTSASTVAPVVQSTTSMPQLNFTSSVAKPVPEIPVPTPAVPEVSAAESSVVPVIAQTPFPEVVTPAETAAKGEPVNIPSTESTVVASDVAGNTKPVEESYSILSQDVTTVQQSAVSTAKPTAGEVHRVHPVTPSIVFPSKAPPKISQSVNVQQFGVSSSSSPENPLTFVSSTTVTTSRSDSSKSTIEALRFEQVALSHPIVIRPVKSPLPIAIPHRVIKHSADGVSVVRTHSTGTITGHVETSSR